MKTCEIKLYSKLVPDVAHKVYKMRYTLKSVVTNAVALMNRKMPEVIATVTF